MNPSVASLSIFPLPLVHVVLCGGKGVAPAYGPLCLEGDVYPYMIEPWPGCAPYAVRTGRAAHVPTREPALWSIPLDASPWSARLALVAAWMLSEPPPQFAAHRYAVAGPAWLADEVFSDGRYIALSAVVTNAKEGARCFVIDLSWCAKTGDLKGYSLACYWAANLSTLPAHLAVYPPVVALLLALYDVPEIRARVETT